MRRISKELFFFPGFWLLEDTVIISNVVKPITVVNPITVVIAYRKLSTHIANINVKEVESKR